MNIRFALLKDYEENGLAGRQKNKAKQSQIQRQNTEYSSQNTGEKRKQTQSFDMVRPCSPQVAQDRSKPIPGSNIF